MAFFSKFFGDPNEKEVQKLRSIVDQIRTYEKTLTGLSDADLKAKIPVFKEAIAKHVEKQKEKVDQLENEMFQDEAILSPQYKKELKTKHENEMEKLHKMYQDKLWEILPEVYAVIGDACRRLKGTTFEVRGHTITWEIVPFDVQFIGATVLHQGRISEMKTGEGKTFVASMPLILNALTGLGVHLVTVNEYLVQRDREWMNHLYNYLGLTSGVIMSGMNPEEKLEAYNADITYGTNNEFGFDYLRDNMAVDQNQLVQKRDLHFAIVDEVDSILIDEARTPLIISAPAAESTDKYHKYSELVKYLEEGTHYNIDEKQKTATLTEEGIGKMEAMMGVENIYTQAGFKEVHHIEQSLKAMACFKRDIDYVVVDDQVQIVDEFTGRILHGRRYSQGLHQAIEAKEKVDVQRESMTLATVTFQNLFRLYKKLAGMTGTAITEAEEFGKIYHLEVVSIPTNRTVTRKDKSDSIFLSEHGKFKAIAKQVKELQEKGQPVLVGTISIEKSEKLARLLVEEGVPHNVLNAKFHEKEAEIVANAGQKGAVTIATNMAGRGTDIKISDEVKELGGLVILGTERHESRRIDNQLRGRSGRQGDPGESQFFISMDDDLMRIFGGDRMKSIMASLKVPEDLPIENGIITKQIESAQKKVENHHYDIRENVVKYDDVMNKHREIIYARRRRVLKHTHIRSEMVELMKQEAHHIVGVHTSSSNHLQWNRLEIAEKLKALYHDDSYSISEEDLDECFTQDEIIEKAQDYLLKAYERREALVNNAEIMRKLERSLYLRAIDVLWMEHLETMQYIRQGVSLRGYGQRDPLVEYKNEAFMQFEKLLTAITESIVESLMRIDLTQFMPQEAQIAPIADPDHITVIKTNADEVESTLYGSDIEMADIQQKQVEVIRAGGSANVHAREVVGENGIRLTRKERKKLEKEGK